MFLTWIIVVKNNLAIVHISEHRARYIDMATSTLTEAEGNRLIVQHMDIVPVVAAKHRGGKRDFEELCAAGREGLVRAARTFDPRKGQFPPRAAQCIDDAIITFLRSERSGWFPKEADGPLSPREADKIERVYEWDAWGDFGNALAICEGWLTEELLRTGASPEGIALSYELVRDKTARFAAAFISLTSIERKMVRLCYMIEPAMTINAAAREIGISRYRASRSLKKALETMRTVIKRIEDNERVRSHDGHPRTPAALQLRVS